MPFAPCDPELTAYSSTAFGWQAIVTSLSEVITAATEVLDAMAHGELLGSACAHSPPEAWVDVFVETLVAHVDRNVVCPQDLDANAMRSLPTVIARSLTVGHTLRVPRATGGVD